MTKLVNWCPLSVHKERNLTVNSSTLGTWSWLSFQQTFGLRRLTAPVQLVAFDTSPAKANNEMSGLYGALKVSLFRVYFDVGNSRRLALFSVALNSFGQEARRSACERLTPDSAVAPHGKRNTSAPSLVEFK